MYAGDRADHCDAKLVARIVLNSGQPQADYDVKSALALQHDASRFAGVSAKAITTCPETIWFNHACVG